MYRVRNDNFYYPLYCATFRAKTTGHNINYAPGLNSGNTPDWKTGVAISDTANLFDSKSHNFTVSLNGKNVKASVDGTTVIDNNYIGAEGGNFATGYLGYFVRGIDIEIYSTKVTVKKPTQYEKLVPAINPAILANTGDTIDLTKYGVTADDGTILFENAVWTSDDITITNGKVTRNCEIRVVRDGIVICEDKIDSLRRFKDDVKEVAQGYECGISLDKFADIKEGDVFEAFIMEEYRD
jgi:hypothetical protein